MSKSNSETNVALLMIILLILWLGLVILFTSCNPKLEEEDYSLYTIEMTLVNNMVITETYRLPNDSSFFIDGANGHYWLEGHSDKANTYQEIREGVLYYRILNVEKCQKQF